MGADGSTPAFLAVDTDELRSAGNAMLADSDLVATASRHILMASSSEFGSGDLGSAARRFRDRYSYALQQLTDELEQAGRSLRGTAEAYEYMDTSASDAFNQLGTRW